MAGDDAGLRASGSGRRETGRRDAGGVALRAARLGLRQRFDARDHGARRRNTAAVGNHLTHAGQLVEARLHDIKQGLIRRDRTVVDLHDQGFQLVAQVAHRHDARHAGAAFQRVQWPLQSRTVLGATRLRAPVAQGLLGRFDELRGLFGEDRCDFGIEVSSILRRLWLLLRNESSDATSSTEASCAARAAAAAANR